MAVVSPVATLLVAHLQAGWNRSRQEMGKSGRTAYLIAVTMLGLFAAIPAVSGSLLGGYFLGRALPHPIAVRVLGGVLAGLALVGGLAGGLFGGTRVLGWESTRVFPLRLRSLFLAELIAGLGDLMPLTLATISASFLLAIGLAKPMALPFLPLLWLGTVGSMLCIQYLVGSLTARIAKHLKAALLVLGILLWIFPVLLSSTGRAAQAPARGKHPPIPAPVARVLTGFGRTLDALPSTQSARGLGEALQGRGWRALARQIYPAAVLALLLLAAAATLQRDSDPQAFRPVAKGTKEQLWSFSSPVHGIARLQWNGLITSHLGRFQLLIPLMVLVLLKGPLAGAKGSSLWAVPMAFAYLSLSGMQCQLNQFGLDGPGVKALLLLPVSARDLLVGKALGLLAFLSLQALLLLILLGFTHHLGPIEALAGLCLSGCLFLLQTSLGHWTSAWMPRPMPRDSLKNTNQAQPVIWLGMAATSLGTAFFGGAYVLVAWLAPALLLPVMGLLLAGMYGIYKRIILPATTIYLDRRREALVQALG